MRHLLLFMLILCLLGGCVSNNAVPLVWYTLDPQPEIASCQKTPITLGLRPLFAAEPYERAIAYRDANLEVGYEENTEWAELPAVMVTRALTDALNASGRFADVGNAGDMTRPDWILTGEVRKFYEERSSATPSAYIEVRLEVREALGKNVLWTDTLSTREALAPPADAAALAAAMNTALTQLITDATAAICGL